MIIMSHRTEHMEANSTWSQWHSSFPNRKYTLNQVDYVCCLQQHQTPKGRVLRDLHLFYPEGSGARWGLSGSGVSSAALETFMFNVMKLRRVNINSTFAQIWSQWFFPQWSVYHRYYCLFYWLLFTLILIRFHCSVGSSSWGPLIYRYSFRNT